MNTDQSSSSLPLPRDEMAFAYLEQLPYPPYPFQEQAILSWFDSDDGVLVCAPTGMGKTLIAEAALFEALHTGRRAYYTTPLIALTEQKFREIQETAVRWGFDRNDVGLVTGNRKENPDATILVVVAEILFNRLLTASISAGESPIAKMPIDTAELPKSFSLESSSLTPESVARKAEERGGISFDNVSAVVMDEFHNFTDPERGIVWEFTLGLLPRHIRTLLISATVGNAYEFVSWLRVTTKRHLSLIESTQRKVPLTYSWVGDKLLPEFLEEIHAGDDEERLVPALVFCFNRDECWDIAEVVKGKNIIDSARQKAISEKLELYDWTQGAGPKLRQLLLRGVGVHHAGVLAKYRRIIEDFYQQKLLSICICTETLAAGINLPTRSTILPTLMKGPPGEKKLIDSSSAHQMFGRAGRPQFDSRGFVFVLAHEDDVRIARFREKYDQIPDDTKDPKLREAKKKMKKRLPTRNPNDQYWTEQQFDKLRNSSPGKLTSRGPLPWRLLAHMIETNPDITPIRALVSRRLMGVKRLAIMHKSLDSMLLSLWLGGFIRLDPNPVLYGIKATPEAVEQERIAERKAKELKRKNQPFAAGLFSDAILNDLEFDDPFNAASKESGKEKTEDTGKLPEEIATIPLEERRRYYKAQNAYPTKKIQALTHLRGVNPVYGLFLVDQLGIADRAERMQAFESLLEMPSVVARSVRVPKQSELPPGELAQNRLDKQLLELGIATVEELIPKTEEEQREEWEKNRRFGGYAEERVFVLTLAEKLKRLFDHEYPEVLVRIEPVWAAGEILFEFNGDFNKFIVSNRLQKQEGVVFRHLLRLILLLEEFHDLVPPETTQLQWQNDLGEMTQMLVDCCRKVDPTGTEETLKKAKAGHGG